MLIFISFIPEVGVVSDVKKELEEKIVGSNVQNSPYKIIDYKISDIPQKIDPYASISLGSRSAIFIDYDSGKILYEKNKDQRLPMASLTKLMTALIVIEKIDKNTVLVVPDLRTRPLDSVMGISPGQKLKAIELLHGLLMESGSDATETLVNAVSKDSNDFIALMNEKASLLGLSDTQFTNSVGYDDSGHYSTASDMAKLARIALKNKTISEISSKINHIAVSEEGKKFALSNTNHLLDGINYRGLKTGTTFGAGECLVSYYEDGNQKIIGVIMGSGSRFYETEKSIEWTKGVFTW